MAPTVYRDEDGKDHLVYLSLRDGHTNVYRQSLSNGAFPAGYHQVTWTGRDASGRAVPSGIPIARLVTPQYTKSIMACPELGEGWCC